MDLEIVCSPELPQSQVEVLHEAVASEGIDVSKQYSNVSSDAILIGTVMLSMGFAAKAFLDSFFQEAGRDAYAWLKSKLALRKAKAIQPIFVQYSAHVSGIYFSDERCAEFEVRHDAFPRAVRTVLTELELRKIDRVEAVKLHYDERSNRYLKAELFESTIIRMGFDEKGVWGELRKPVAVIDLPEER
jgi:hypothetical protein